MDDEKIVVDTNVLLSAALNKNGAARQAFSTALKNYTLLQSDETLAEFVEVVDREKFDRYISNDTRYLLKEDVSRDSELVEITHRVGEGVCRDQKDNKFLELAVSGGAKYILSGDKDLLVIGEYQGIKILSPRGFIEREQGLA